MAEFKSVTYTAQEVVTGDASKMFATAELISGKVSFLQVEYVTPATTANGDTALLAYLPSGMTLVPAMCTVETVAGSGAATIDVGIQGVVEDSIASNLDVSAAGTQILTLNSSPYVKYSERKIIEATFSAGGLTAGRTLYFNFFLVNSN
tara:strand:- start:42713 stop:43159 length:447 start_codon:yes stop_codon:yes gene_type:complete